MLTVAVPAANAQLTAPSAGAGAPTTAATVATNAIKRQGRINLRRPERARSHDSMV
jgi:hypothetical protein